MYAYKYTYAISFFETSQIQGFYEFWKTEKEEVVISTETWTADLLRRKLMRLPLDHGAPLGSVKYNISRHYFPVPKQKIHYLL